MRRAAHKTILVPRESNHNNVQRGYQQKPPECEKVYRCKAGTGNEQSEDDYRDGIIPEPTPQKATISQSLINSVVEQIECHRTSAC